jgi:hypothetical protein
MCNGFKKMTGESEPAKAIRESQKVYATITKKYSAQAYGKPDDEDDEDDEDDGDDDGDDDDDNDDDEEDDEDNNVEDGSQITLEPEEIRAETQPFPAAVPVIDNETAPMNATIGNKKRKRKTLSDEKTKNSRHAQRFSTGKAIGELTSHLQSRTVQQQSSGNDGMTVLATVLAENARAAREQNNMMIQFMTAMMRPQQYPYPPTYQPYPYQPYQPDQPSNHPFQHNVPTYPSNEQYQQPTSNQQYQQPTLEQPNIPTYHQVSQSSTVREHTPFEERIIYSSSSSYGRDASKDEDDIVSKRTLS